MEDSSRSKQYATCSIGFYNGVMKTLPCEILESYQDHKLIRYATLAGFNVQKMENDR
jgi:hypothetical protein